MKEFDLFWEALSSFLTDEKIKELMETIGAQTKDNPLAIIIELGEHGFEMTARNCEKEKPKEDKKELLN
jgi:hypothetical protein